MQDGERVEPFLSLELYLIVGAGRQDFTVTGLFRDFAALRENPAFRMEYLAGLLAAIAIEGNKLPSISMARL
ncbi:hypothetical protein PSAC2689_10704 [Paraburkholderia sacchari]